MLIGRVDIVCHLLRSASLVNSSSRICWSMLTPISSSPMKLSSPGSSGGGGRDGGSSSGGGGRLG